MGLICAIMVVVMHFNLAYFARSHETGFLYVMYKFLHNGLFRASMPFFFAASGYFLAVHSNESGWWRRAVLKRIKTLLIPFVIWNFLFACESECFVIISNFMQGRTPLIGVGLAIKKCIMPQGMFNPFGLPVLSVFWYVLALFVLVIISPLIIAALRRVFWLFVILIVVLYYVFYADDIARFVGSWRAVQCRFLSIEGFFWFSIGAWCAIKKRFQGSTLMWQ